MSVNEPVEIDFLSPFKSTAQGVERIGIEIEFATLEMSTGRAARYDGPNGTGKLLLSILDKVGGEPILGRDGPVGIRLSDGAKISLEACGAFEYSTPPADDLTTLDDQMRARMAVFAAHAAALDLAFVAGGSVPFDTLETVQWVPDEHVQTMRDFCERLGDPGVASMEVSALAVTTQTTLDFLSKSDLTEKVRVGFTSAVVASALFVNSPLVAGEPSGYLSWRMSRLRREDPTRFGFPPFAMNADISAEHFVRWLRDLPMIHRVRDGHDLPAPDRAFSDLLIEGFDDGTLPDDADWRTLVSQAWPFVRLRNTIEVRLPDGLPYNGLMAAPAFWAGLLYHKPSRDAAWQLMADASIADHLRAMDDVAVRGLAAVHKDTKVKELAGELLRLASEGLQALVRNGRERPAAMRFLDPLHAVLDADETFAQQLLRRWETEFDRRPERFIAAFAVQPQ